MQSSNCVKISILQSVIHSKNRDRNLANFQSMLETSESNSNLYILPETFSCGFVTDSTAIVEDMKGMTLSWMKKMAALKKAVIVGSLFIKTESDGIKNRMFWVRPDNSYVYYDKVYLFTPGNENKLCTPGNKRVITELNGVRFLLNICYDLRFPLSSRQKNDYDALINIANWPSLRADARMILLQARAIENQVWTIGVNRIGIDHLNHKYSGESCIIGPDGKIKLNAHNKQGIYNFTIDKLTIEEYRNLLPFYADANDFTILR